MRAEPGIIALARLSGVPIVPVAYSLSRGKNLKSWDRFLIGGLFARGVFIWGEPLSIARDAEPETQEQARLHIEQALNSLTAEADRAVGRTPVEPAAIEGTAS